VDDRLGEEEHTYYSPCPQLAGRVTRFVVLSPSPHFIPPLLFYRVCASCLVVAADPY
jgi:hypothetical protein